MSPCSGTSRGFVHAGGFISPSWVLAPPVPPQISDAVYRMVYEQTKAQYDAMVAKCEVERAQMESTIRTDMDQIITSKEHLSSKIRGESRGDGAQGGCARVDV